MVDFETAVDQMLAGTDDEGSFGQDSEWEGGGIDLSGDYESYGDFEGSDFDGLDFATEESEVIGPSFESDFESAFSGESEFEWSDESDHEFEFLSESPSGGGLLSEAELDELAKDLVGVTTPQEMEAFFGKLFKGVAKVAGRALKGGIGKKLLRAGSSLIGRALPIVGSGLGTALLPGIGTGLGGALGGQLRNLFSRRGRRSLGRSLTRNAVRSARRAGRSNPLASLLGRRGGSALRSLFGFEMEAGYGDPQIEIAKRMVRTVADAANIAGRNDNESDAAIAAAFRQAATNNLPTAVRAAMLTGPVTR